MCGFLIPVHKCTSPLGKIWYSPPQPAALPQTGCGNRMHSSQLQGTWLDLDFPANLQTSSAILSESSLFQRRIHNCTACGFLVLTSTNENEQREPHLVTQKYTEPQTADPVFGDVHKGWSLSPSPPTQSSGTRDVLVEEEGRGTQ